MTAEQRFLLLLILVGALATVLGLVSKRARLLPYPVVLGLWNLLAFVFNAILFILVGAALPATTLLPVIGLVLVGFVIMLVTRAVPVYGLLALAAYRGPSIPWRWGHFTWWAGLRGALSVALALSVAGLNGIDRRVSVVAYGIVLLSLLVQGALMAPITRALHIEATS
jgi:monovalent cation:H+ antiporter, CPA1 family